MSFYLMLSSSGSRNPNDHGGDFKVTLDHVLDMKTEAWEVALVEMSYSGQAFSNLSPENSEVFVRASGKPEFQNDYIITWDQALDLYVEVKQTSARAGHPGPSNKYAYLEFPRQHYSWTSFKETFEKMYKEKIDSEIYIKDNEFYFRAKNEDFNTWFEIQLSPNLKKLFGIPAEKEWHKWISHDHNNRWVMYTIPIVKPQVAPDSSKAIYTPYAKDDSWNIFEDGILYLKFEKDQYWTVNMLQKAFEAIVKESKSINLKSITIDPSQVVIEAKNNAKPSTIIFSQSLADVFSMSTTNFVLISGRKTIIPITPVSCEEKDMNWRTYSASTRLRYDFYPNVSSLITDLNSVLELAQIDISKDRKSSTIIYTFFSVNEGNIIKFKGKEGFEVLLDSDVQKMMFLPTSLTRTVQGTASTILMPGKRHLLYVHCDCLDYHYINNNVSDLLKIIQNNAEVDEKVFLNFSDPHYYAVSRRPTDNINMFITDGLFNNILPFNREVFYTLHFRKCRSL